MLGLLKFPDDFHKSTGLNQLWYKDNGTDASIDGNNRNNDFVAQHDMSFESLTQKAHFHSESR